jgi:hypothetical protein
VYVARALRTFVRATRCYLTALDDIPARPNSGSGAALSGQAHEGPAMGAPPSTDVMT